MVVEGGDSHRTDATFDGGDSGKIGAVVNFWCNIALKNTVFTGGASVDDTSAWANHIIRN